MLNAAKYQFLADRYGKFPRPQVNLSANPTFLHVPSESTANDCSNIASLVELPSLQAILRVTCEADIVIPNAASTLWSSQNIQPAD
jgi:hypothetical protein